MTDIFFFITTKCQIWGKFPPRRDILCCDFDLQYLPAAQTKAETNSQACRFLTQDLYTSHSQCFRKIKGFKHFPSLEIFPLRRGA